MAPRNLINLESASKAFDIKPLLLNVSLGLAEAGLAGRGVAPAPFADEAVDLGHEGLEMHPALFRFGGRGEEKVHQHGLAAPHRAPEIDPTRRLAATET